MMQLSPALAASGWRIVTTTSDVGAMHRSNGFGRRLLVTFDSLSDYAHRRQAVPGDRLAASCEADHLHVCTTLANWYQSPDLADVIDAASGIRRAYDEVILYGHSMGGYGALLLSAPLAATNVVAFVPQFSVDPVKVPFETRFSSHVETTSFVFDDMSSSISRGAPKHVVFDPHYEPDRRHFDLFARIENIRPLRIPFAGHYPGQMLREGGVLRPLVMDLVLQASPDTERRRIVRAVRRRSHRYFVERAVHVARRGRLMDAIVLVNIAYVLDPTNPSVLETYQALLNFDSRYYGLAHAMVRLTLKERPEWTFYESTLANLWRELEKHARPVIGPKTA